MVICTFFLIGVLLLIGIDPGFLALAWHDPNIFHFCLTIITHMFAHANLRHLLRNYTFVAPYAFYLEHKIGPRKVVDAWLICGLTALVFDGYTLLLGSPQDGVIGSSGAACGLFAMGSWIATDNRWLKWAARSFLLYFLYEQAYFTYLSLTNPMFAKIPVGFAAHVGGLVSGIYLAWRWNRSNPKPLRRQSRSSSHK